MGSRWGSQRAGEESAQSESAGTSAKPSTPVDSRPRGYRAGDVCFYVAGSQKLASGNQALFGQRGEVVGPATIEPWTSKGGVDVVFPDNKASA